MLSKNVSSWVMSVLGDGVEIVSAETLKGSTSATLHLLTITNGNQTDKVVVRQFTLEGWVAIEPDLAKHEAAVLEAVSSLPIATPKVIGFDEDGSRCGVPTILMSFVEGKVDLHPPDLDVWLNEIARVLSVIHQMQPPTDFGWRYKSWVDRANLEIPPWSTQPGAWQTAIHHVNQPAPEYKPRLIHRDYHPVNLLWQGHNVSGIVDWVNGCIGPTGNDIGHCRGNLALLCGVDSADKFLDHYLNWMGSDSDYNPYWDLDALLDGDIANPSIYTGWTDFGITQLTIPLLKKRLDEYIVSILARC